MFRIQKVLLAEYQDLYETVLVESPFAEVTAGGVGIRQVQLGLTPTKIIVGQDVFEASPPCCLGNVPLVEKDPEIECFQLTSILPLDALRITFYKKAKRIVMHVSVQERRTHFYEFGGHLSRNLFWNIWRERIATLRQMGANLFNISASSPFSSTDVIPDEQEVTVSVHPSPRSYLSSDYDTSTPCPQPEVRTLYKRYSSMFTDVIEKASSAASQVPDPHHQWELENYFRSLAVTNSFSCGCNTSW